MSQALVLAVAVAVSVGFSAAELAWQSVPSVWRELRDNGYGLAVQIPCPPESESKVIPSAGNLPTGGRDRCRVDAVLSADVDDAPMRQRQYTAPVEVPSASAH